MTDLHVPDAESAGSNELSKRYECERCGSQLLCVTAGAGCFHCHGQPMDLLAAKQLPASD